MKRKIRIGKVVSDKMDKTRVVLVERQIRHNLYEKTMRIKKKYYAHDENNESRVGDIVRIIESRPLSKLKRWRIIEIVQKSSE